MSDSPVIFNRIALIGAGLIGSSIAHASRRFGLAKHISAYIPRDKTRDRAAKAAFADSLHADIASAVAGADLVVLATPLGTFGELTKLAAPHLMPGAILTDVGSVKGAVVRDISPNVPAGVHFIPGHPVAGTEESGPESGFAELFDGRWCILTPLPGTDPAALERLKDFWRRCGSDVEIMDVQHHDLVLAITSHVPHLIAYNIVGTAADLETVTRGEVIKYSASGFRDFTRIAASDPTMWRDIFLTNRDAVLEMLGRFNEDLAALQRAVRWGDGESLFKLFTRTRAIRRSIIEAGQDTAEPNFGRLSRPGRARR
jgi:cyclohexadieny/prephenate dehydrogenase